MYAILTLLTINYYFLFNLNSLLIYCLINFFLNFIHHEIILSAYFLDYITIIYLVYYFMIFDQSIFFDHLIYWQN